MDCNLIFHGLFLRDFNWIAPSTYHLPSPAKPYLFLSAEIRIFKWHTENFHLIDDFLLSLKSGSIIAERIFVKVMLFCYKPPAGIYHSQSWKIYSEESESVNWHRELLWENQALEKSSCHWMIALSWESWSSGKGRQCDLSPSNQRPLHRITSVSKTK